MTENVTVVQPRHRNLTDHHLQEGRERREDTLFLPIEPESSGSGEVAALHDTRRHEDVGVFLVNNFEPCGPFEIA